MGELMKEDLFSCERESVAFDTSNFWGAIGSIGTVEFVMNTWQVLTRRGGGKGTRHDGYDGMLGGTHFFTQREYREAACTQTLVILLIRSLVSEDSFVFCLSFTCPADTVVETSTHLEWHNVAKYTHGKLFLERDCVNERERRWHAANKYDVVSQRWNHEGLIDDPR